MIFSLTFLFTEHIVDCLHLSHSIFAMNWVYIPRTNDGLAQFLANFIREKEARSFFFFACVPIMLLNMISETFYIAYWLLKRFQFLEKNGGIRLNTYTEKLANSFVLQHLHVFVCFSLENFARRKHIAMYVSEKNNYSQKCTSFKILWSLEVEIALLNGLVE